MGTVIKFPSTENSKAMASTIVTASEILKEAGLSAEQIQQTTEELRRSLRPLFDHDCFTFELPGGLGLNDEQASAITKAAYETLQKAVGSNNKNIAYAVQVITGLTAKLVSQN